MKPLQHRPLVRLTCWLLLFGCLGPAVARAAAPLPDRPRVTIVRTETPPKIDGKLDDSAWESAAVIDGIRQEVPIAYGVPSQHTVVRLLYDENFIYIGVRAFDTEPDKIIAKQMVRDADMTLDDRVSFNFDTLHDERNGYYFQINPLGNKRDGLIDNGTPKFNWDGIWYAAGSIDSQGYVVEVAIPFKTLSIQPGKTTWGMQIFRGIKRDNETNRWASPTPNMAFFNMTGAGYLDGLEGMQQGWGLDVVPGAALRYVNDPIEDREYTRFDPTFDAFYKLTPSLTGSLTVNTDFGDAEVDTVRVNLTRFPLFFPEKRQFFLQDEGIFDFGGLARNPLPFFSRRIGLSSQGQPIDIIAGVKVTGRVGRFNIGLLDVVTDAYTREPTDDDPAFGPVRIKTKNLAVARISANVLEESTAGMIFTYGDPNSNADNLLYGLDFNYRNSNILPGRTLIARAWGQGTSTEGPSGDEWAWGARLQYPNDRVNWQIIAEEVRDDFFPALGFTSRVDVRNYFGSYRYRIRPERYLRTIDTQITGTFVTGTDNRWQTGILNFTPFTIRNPIGDLLEFTYQRAHERLLDPFEISDGIVIPADAYGWNRFVVTAASSNGRPLSVTMTVRAGSFFGGNRLDLVPSLLWRPSKYLLLSLGYERNDIDLPQGSFTVHVARFRINFQFNTRISWNTFIQYDSVSDQIGINSRIRWIIVPGSELFVVLNQGLDVADGLRRGRTEPRIKLNWTFRF